MSSAFLAFACLLEIKCGAWPLHPKDFACSGNAVVCRVRRWGALWRWCHICEFQYPHICILCSLSACSIHLYLTLLSTMRHKMSNTSPAGSWLLAISQLQSDCLQRPSLLYAVFAIPFVIGWVLHHWVMPCITSSWSVRCHEQLCAVGVLEIFVSRTSRTLHLCYSKFCHQWAWDYCHMAVLFPTWSLSDPIIITSATI